MTTQNGGTQRPLFDVSAYKGLFLSEARTCLSSLRQNLARLADEPADREALQEALRAAHTIKGMAATMHYYDLAAVAGRLESSFRSAPCLSPEQTEFLFAGCGEIEAGLSRLDDSGERPDSPGRTH